MLVVVSLPRFVFFRMSPRLINHDILGLMERVVDCVDTLLLVRITGAQFQVKRR